MRWVVAMAMMATLSGCASVEDPFLTGSVSGPASGAPALSQEVPVAYALAALPAAIGAPRSVRQTAPGDDSTVRQQIVYANTTKLAGENVMTVETGRSTDSRFTRAPTRNQLLAEIHKALPGVPMKISTVIGENVYGVFGYATGPAGNGACIYAWQLANAAGGVGGHYPAKVRLRFCHDRISEERIPMLMQGLSVKPLTGQAVSALRSLRGSAMASSSSTYSADVLFDAPAERNVSAEEPAKPIIAPRRVVAVAAKPAEPVAPLPVKAAETQVPLIAHAAKVPMPGDKAVSGAVAQAPAASAESEAAARQKAAEAWRLARARLSGESTQ